jgi:hypothetical protein
MSSLQIGDEVRVVSPSCQWQDWRGTVVDIINRSHEESDATLQECLVVLNGVRRWFMAQHLVKTVPANMVRFLRAEILARWRLDPDQLISLDGSCDQLIAFLQDRFEFSPGRASAEVADFLSTLNERLTQATAPFPTVAADQPIIGPENSAA